MNRQTCCECLKSTTDYVDYRPQLRPEAVFHYCRERGCADKLAAGTAR